MLKHNMLMQKVLYCQKNSFERTLREKKFYVIKIFYTIKDIIMSRINRIKFSCIMKDNETTAYKVHTKRTMRNYGKILEMFTFFPFFNYPIIFI